MPLKIILQHLPTNDPFTQSDTLSDHTEEIVVVDPLPHTKMYCLLTMAWLACVCLTTATAYVHNDATTARASHHTLNTKAVMSRLQTLESPQHERSGATMSGAGAPLASGVVEHPVVQPIQLHPENKHYFLFRGEVRLTGL